MSSEGQWGRRRRRRKGGVWSVVKPVGSMGRPPCCDKMGIKKGPWTPEEDIILVSYIQEHGPGNWRSVPTSTGLMRCSKSCRLRWTNYLRPGIKRGNFTQQEEGMIIQLQTLLGNKWAAIASYLPQRTDNDIKNYWNTHLKKKLKRIHAANGGGCCTTTSSDLPTASSTHQLPVGRQDTTSTAAVAASTTTTTSLTSPGIDQCSSAYASSTENISKLLETWMRPPSRHDVKQDTTHGNRIIINSDTNIIGGGEIERGGSYDHLGFDDSLLSLDNMNGCGAETKQMAEEDMRFLQQQPPFPLLEKWMLDDSLEGLMELSSDCCSSALF